MHRHPSFHMLLHEDEELAGILGSPVAERTLLHEWPLSCVQRVFTEDGKRYIYKAQLPPTLEDEFYSRARSPLLASARPLGRSGETMAMIMEEIDAPRLDKSAPDEDEVARIAAELTRRIAGMGEGLPAMMDIRDEGGWSAFIGSALDDVRALIAEGSFRKMDSAAADDLAHLAEGRRLRDVFRMPMGYVHGDLKADIILVVPGGYLVLDWQRPLRGPVALDTAALMISLGYDPLRHVPAGIVQMHHLLAYRLVCGGGQALVSGGKALVRRVCRRYLREAGRYLG